MIDEYNRRLIEKRNLAKNFSYLSLQELFERNLKRDFKLYQDFHAFIVIEGKNKSNQGEDGKFFKENKIFIAIIIGIFIFEAAFIFLVGKLTKRKLGKNFLVLNRIIRITPEFSDGAIKMAKKIIDGDTFLIERKVRSDLFPS